MRAPTHTCMRWPRQKGNKRGRPLLKSPSSLPYVLLIWAAWQLSPTFLGR